MYTRRTRQRNSTKSTKLYEYIVKGGKKRQPQHTQHSLRRKNIYRPNENLSLLGAVSPLHPSSVKKTYTTQIQKSMTSLDRNQSTNRHHLSPPPPPLYVCIYPLPRNKHKIPISSHTSRKENNFQHPPHKELTGITSFFLLNTSQQHAQEAAKSQHSDTQHVTLVCASFVVFALALHPHPPRPSSPPLPPPFGRPVHRYR